MSERYPTICTGISFAHEIKDSNGLSDYQADTSTPYRTIGPLLIVPVDRTRRVL